MRASVAMCTPGRLCALFEPFAEGLLRHLLQLTDLSPASEEARHPANPALALSVFAHEWQLGYAAQSLSCAEAHFAPEDHCHGPHRTWLVSATFELMFTIDPLLSFNKGRA